MEARARQPDAVVIGAGLVGLALARELHRQRWVVTVLDAGEAPASLAAAGMLAAYQTQNPILRPLAIAAARLYPTWVSELERETAMNCWYRRSGSLVLAPEGAEIAEGAERLAAAQLAQLEPALHLPPHLAAWRVDADHSVDNRALHAALLASVDARGIALVRGCRVEAIELAPDGCRARAGGSAFFASAVINAAGAWAGSIATPVPLPVRPRKGQMLALDGREAILKHVIEAPGVYLVPRDTGAVVIGSTVEDVGFTPGVSSGVIDDLRARAIALAPALKSARVLETWAGFRPCSTDELPIIGPTACPGYWAATGHFRDGILLAPLTAKILAKALTVGYMTRALDLAPFSPQRFSRITAPSPT